MFEFQVPQISCQHCAKAVTTALVGADPQASVQVDVATKQVQVQSQLPQQRLREVLAGAGYPVAN